MTIRKSKTLKVIGIIFVLLLLILGGGLFAVTRGLAEMQDIVINDVNTDELPDGVYTGEFDRYRLKVYRPGSQAGKGDRQGKT